MTSQVFSADSSDFQDAALAPAFSPLYQQIKGLILQGLQSGEWKPGEARTNTLVFIGKNLERAKLTEAFKACLA